MGYRRGRPLTGPEAEDILLEALEQAEAEAEAYAIAAVAAAAAETNYRRTKAKMLLTVQLKTEAAKDAYAVHHCGDLLAERNLTAALLDSAAEACRVRRAAIEVARSLVASVRAAETGRG